MTAANPQNRALRRKQPSRQTDTRRPSNLHTRPIEADISPEPPTDLKTTVAEQVIGALKAEPTY